MAIISHKVEGVSNDVTHYARIYPVNKKGHAQSELDGQIVSALPHAFPAEPSSYNLIGTYSSSQTFTAPESGYYQIEVFGASGSGGTGYSARDTVGSGTEEDPERTATVNTGGGGGGSGAYAKSQVMLNKGDVIELVCGAVGSTSSAVISSSVADEHNLTMNCTAASNGGNARFNVKGVGGAGGAASGGNVTNINGNAGSLGGYAYVAGHNTPGTASGGAGGAAVISGANAGGVGAYTSGYSGHPVTTTTGKTNGSAGFAKIYRGNTNVA